MKIQCSYPSDKFKKKTWGNLEGCALSYSISQIVDNYRDSNFVLVITPDNLTAEKLEQELKFFQNIEKKDQINLLNFPDWETLPYDSFSPHQDIISNRLTTLYKLQQINTGILIIPISTLMHKLCPADFINQSSVIFNIGDKVDLVRLRQKLNQSGYHCVSEVTQHGEFAIRGSIVDLFPMGSGFPVRIDLFDNEIDSIRTFDPDTQRSKNKLTDIKLLPGKEFPFTKEAISNFRSNWRTRFSVDPSNCTLYQDISNEILSPGLEYYLPLFFNRLETIFSYIPENSIIVNVNNVENYADEFWEEIKKRYELYSHDITKPILEPDEIYINKNELFSVKNNYLQIYLSSQKIVANAGKENYQFKSLPDLTVENRKEDIFEKLKDFIQKSKNKILFCAESEGRKEILKDLLNKYDIHVTEASNFTEFCRQKNDLAIIVAPIEDGVTFEAGNISIIPESSILGKHVTQQRRRKRKNFVDHDSYIKSLVELNNGDLVVHIDHGIGRYLGLTKLKLSGGMEAEFVTLEYANSAKLYVPVSSLHFISRYSSQNIDSVSVHPLGSDKWQKDKKKALLKIKDIAAELLNIYAKRKSKVGFSYPAPDEEYEKFVTKFPFEETIDQERAINDVIKDLTSNQPMDRVICGDVGFGKTEVAMRAAFLAVNGGRQVALLVPTTLLAEQHYKNFIDRFAGFPFQIEVLSRFNSAKQQEEIIEKLNNGNCDIVIGTHKLLQEGIKFKNLGLLIIDEEHRFGVKQKEKFKSLRAEIDILTLTATPIPRTLSMAFSGIRDLSIIATPPLKRLSVKTFVREYNEPLIIEAIDREIRRGGQVYYLHNSVSTINKTAEKLSELVSNSRVVVAHGQMPERNLEQVMVDFYHRKFNVLVCTTIIETGIDIPTANTILIERADKFGLAQLHQLRGRVGRSHHQAYAYCMLSPKNKITHDARKRLEAISSSDALGSGFTIATHDLEIRGAGELLGEEQSGNINSIGFNLYMELIDYAVKSLREGKEISLETPISSGPEVDLQIPNLITEEYIPDVHSRLVLYKRIASADDIIELDELKVEIIDRFGLLPEYTENLFKITRLKIKSKAIGIHKIKAGPSGGLIEFINNPNVSTDKIINLVTSNDRVYKFAGSSQIKFINNLENIKSRFEFIDKILNKLAD